LALNPTPALRAEFGDAELARRAGHGGGGSDTRGLVGAGGGCGTWRPGGRDRGHRVCRVRSNWPIWARAIRTPRRSGGRRMCWDAAAPERSPRTGTATRTAAGKSRSAIRVIPQRVRQAPPGGGCSRRSGFVLSRIRPSGRAGPRREQNKAPGGFPNRSRYAVIPGLSAGILPARGRRRHDDDRA